MSRQPIEVLMPNGRFVTIEGGTQIVVPYYPNPTYMLLSFEEKLQNNINRLDPRRKYIFPYLYASFKIVKDVNNIFVAVFDKFV